MSTAQISAASLPMSVGRTSVSVENLEAAKVEQIAAFDVLRFLLAFGVLLSHTGVLTWTAAGNLPVQVFFALSGWLIGSILYNTAPGELSRFYFNRATRIWIPYFTTVTILYLVSAVHEQAHSTRWHEFLIYDLTFTHNWFTLLPNAQLALSQMPLQGTGNHFWSIAVEEQFYLVAPLVMTLMPYGRAVFTWVAIATTAVLTGSLFGSVALGVLCAVIGNVAPGWHLRKSARLALVAILIASMAIMIKDDGAYAFDAPFFSVALVLLCAIPSRRTGITQWLGGVSYPLYLNAWIGVFAFNAIAKRFPTVHGWSYQFGLAICAVAGAACSYQLIDRVVMTHRSRYFSKRTGWLLGASAYLLVTFGLLYGLHEIAIRN